MKYTTHNQHHVAALSDMRSMTAALIPHMKWRRHGIGCLQGYILEGVEPELRVHIWHPDIARENIMDRGDIHDHRFRMVSTVLHGRLRHAEYEITDDPDGHWDVYQVVHARTDIGARYEPVNMDVHQVPGPLDNTQRRVNTKERALLFDAGLTYTFERGAFHRSFSPVLTVTLVRKYDQIAAKAQILSHHGTEPVHAFEKDDDFDMVPYLANAIEALTGTVYG